MSSRQQQVAPEQAVQQIQATSNPTKDEKSGTGVETHTFGVPKEKVERKRKPNGYRELEMASWFGTSMEMVKLTATLR